jgi:hypothetical protein
MDREKGIRRTSLGEKMSWYVSIAKLHKPDMDGLSRRRARIISGSKR